MSFDCIRPIASGPNFGLTPLLHEQGESISQSGQQRCLSDNNPSDTRSACLYYKSRTEVLQGQSSKGASTDWNLPGSSSHGDSWDIPILKVVRCSMIL